jgi:hypothetical protein
MQQTYTLKNVAGQGKWRYLDRLLPTTEDLAVTACSGRGAVEIKYGSSEIIKYLKYIYIHHPWEKHNTSFVAEFDIITRSQTITQYLNVFPDAG